MPTGVYLRTEKTREILRKSHKSNSGYFKKGHKVNLGKICSDETKRKIGEGNKGKIISEEHRKKMRIKLKGRKPWNTGKSLSEEHKKSISDSNKGKQKPPGFGDKVRKRNAKRKEQLGYFHSPEAKLKIGKASIGRKASIETRRKISESHRGKKSYLWEGGITRLNIAIRRTYKYRLWREDVFKKDNHTCQSCFIRGGYLEADHIKAFCLILKEHNIHSVEEALQCEELWNINNGRTLCKPCHRKTDNHAGRAKLLLKSKNN